MDKGQGLLTLQVGVAEHLSFPSPVPNTLVAEFFNAGCIAEGPRSKWFIRFTGGLEMPGKSLATIRGIQSCLF